MCVRRPFSSQVEICENSPNSLLFLISFLFVILPVFPFDCLTFQFSQGRCGKLSYQHPAQVNPTEQMSQPKSPSKAVVSQCLDHYPQNGHTSWFKKVWSSCFGARSSCFVQSSMFRVVETCGIQQGDSHVANVHSWLKRGW